MPLKSIPVQHNDISNHDIIIAIMGPTGSGKSNFIDVVTGEKKRAGAGLESFTQKVQAIRLLNHETYQNHIVLVDTPGFDDTHRSDMEILEMIGDWLKKTYKAKIKLSGILYMHRITDNRMAGSPYRNLRMFGELCGDRAIEKVALVTTMWDRVGPALGESRESELLKRYWAQMIDHRATHWRFNNSESSAWDIIIKSVVQKNQTRQVLLLQEELVDLKKRINETKAGKALYAELYSFLEKQQENVRRLEDQAKQNPMMAQVVQEEKARTQADIDNIFKQLNALKVSFNRKFVLFFKKKPQAHALVVPDAA